MFSGKTVVSQGEHSVRKTKKDLLERKREQVYQPEELEFANSTPKER